jgi:hypothetical protein
MLQDALPQVFDHLVETFPFLWSQLEELHAEVVAGPPGDLCLVHLDRLVEGWEVYTQCQYRSKLYGNFAFNGSPSRGEVDERPLANSLISLERNRALYEQPPISPSFHLCALLVREPLKSGAV